MPKKTVMLVALAVVHLGLVVDSARKPVSDPAGRALIWPLHNDTMHRIGPGADFFAVYHAGAAIQTGLDPYDGNENPRVTPYFYPFRYLPVVAQTLGRAVVHLSPWLAWWTWIAVLEVMVAALVWKVVWPMEVEWARWFALVTLLFSTPYLLEVFMGQFTFFTVAATTLAVSERWRGDWARGGSLAVAALLKVFPLAVIPALVRHRRFWFPIALVLAVMAGSTVPTFLLHPDWARTFVAANFTQPAGGMDSGNFGLTYLLFMLVRELGPGWHAAHWMTFTAVWRMSMLGGAAALAFFGRARDAVAGPALLLLAHFLTYVHVWEHHMSGVVVIGVLLLGHVSQSGRRREAAGAAFALVALALPTLLPVFDGAKDPAVGDPSIPWPLWMKCAVVACKAVPTLMLFVVALVACVRAPVATSVSPAVES